MFKYGDLVTLQISLAQNGVRWHLKKHQNDNKIYFNLMVNYNIFQIFNSQQDDQAILISKKTDLNKFVWLSVNSVIKVKNIFLCNDCENKNKYYVCFKNSFPYICFCNCNENIIINYFIKP